MWGSTNCGLLIYTNIQTDGTWMIKKERNIAGKLFVMENLINKLFYNKVYHKR